MTSTSAVSKSASIVLNKAALASGRLMQDGLELTWQSGERSLFHLIWLRDNCSRGRGWIDGIWTRIELVGDLPARPQAERFSVDPGGLRITWTDTPLESHFDADWLLSHRYDRPRAFERLPRRLWDAGLERLPEVAAESALEADDGRAMLDALVREGVVLVRGGEARTGFAVPFISRFATVIETPFGKTWQARIKPEGDARSCEYEYEELALHTDFTFSRFAGLFEFFHCVRVDAEGGATTLADGFRIAEDLRIEDPEAFGLLSSWSVPYQAYTSTHDMRMARPIINLARDGEVEMIASADRMMAPLAMPPEVIQPFYGALRTWMSRAASARYLVEVRLEPGDLLLWDNRRLLHGRRGLSRAHGHERLLEGGYFHPDDIESRWRRLAPPDRVGDVPPARR